MSCFIDAQKQQRIILYDFFIGLLSSKVLLILNSFLFNLFYTYMLQKKEHLCFFFLLEKFEKNRKKEHYIYIQVSCMRHKILNI